MFNFFIAYNPVRSYSRPPLGSAQKCFGCRQSFKRSYILAAANQTVENEEIGIGDAWIVIGSKTIEVTECWSNVKQHLWRT